MKRTDYWQKTIRLNCDPTKLAYPYPLLYSIHVDFFILVYIIALFVHSSI